MANMRKSRIKSTEPAAKLAALLESPAYWEKFEREMAQAAEERAARRKDTVLHLRVNSRVLARLKEKAAAGGMRYQTFIAQILAHAAGK